MTDKEQIVQLYKEMYTAMINKDNSSHLTTEAKCLCQASATLKADETVVQYSKTELRPDI